MPPPIRGGGMINDDDELCIIAFVEQCAAAVIDEPAKRC